MIIRSVTVESFGTIAGPLTIEFDEKLNVVCGPNETGKSTLLKAIWFAFTRRASSQAQEIKEIVPYTGGTPEVKVTLERDGRRYTITKRFSASSSLTQLEVVDDAGNIEIHQDDDADELLGEVLGLGAPSGRTKSPSHEGFWPLTWMRQHQRVTDPATLLADGGDPSALSELLGRLTGEVLAGSDGEVLLEKVKNEYDTFYTSGGNETTRSGAPLHEAKTRLENSTRDLRDLQQQQLAYEDNLARYDALLAEREDLSEDLPRLKKEASDARARRDDVRRVRGQLETARARRETSVSRVERAEEAVKTRQDLRTSFEQLETDKNASAKKVDELRKEEAAHGEGRPSLQAEVDQCGSERERMHRLVQLFEAHLTVVRASNESKELKGRLSAAEKRQDELAGVRGKLKQISIDEEAVTNLEALERGVHSAEAALRSASAQIRLRGLDSVEIRIGEETVRLSVGDEERRQIEAPTTFAIPDVLEVEVTPGGDELGELRRQLDEARSAFKEALEEVDVDSVAASRKLLHEQSQLASREEDLVMLLKETAPDGVQALRDVLSETEEAASSRIKWRPTARTRRLRSQSRRLSETNPRSGKPSQNWKPGFRR